MARQGSPVAREIMPEIGRAKASFLEALEGAEFDPVSDTAQKSFLSVSDTYFGFGFGIREITSCHFLANS